MELPRIIADVALMHLINENYSSIFLKDELKIVIEESIKNIKSGTHQQSDFEIFYFDSLYMIANSKSLSIEYIQDFIKDFVERETLLGTKISLPIVVLLRTMIVNSNIDDDKNTFNNMLQSVQRRLSKKFKLFYADIFSFKNRKDRLKLNELAKVRH
jgi:hypothetical protein